MSNKPVVFFCHSAVDKDYLSILQSQIRKATSDDIEIFQSSDGESVSFGNNWVHKLEEALSNAALTFVFISPEALASNWIQFEAGLSYGRGISVVPVGIKGIDVARLDPPLSLLQGFNLSSENGMNNIISVVNKKLSSSYPEDFTEDSFHQLTSSIQEKKSYLNLVDSIAIPLHEKISVKDITYSPSSNSLNEIQSVLELHDFRSIQRDSLVLTNGLSAKVDNRDTAKVRGEVTIDPLSVYKFEPFINDLIPRIYDQLVTKYWLNVHLAKGLSFERKNYKLSGRLESYGVEHDSSMNGQLRYKSLTFHIQTQQRTSSLPKPQAYLTVIFEVGNFNCSDFVELIQILYDSNCIYTDK